MLNQLSPAYLLPGETGLTFLMIALPRCHSWLVDGVQPAITEVMYLLSRARASHDLTNVIYRGVAGKEKGGQGRAPSPYQLLLDKFLNWLNLTLKRQLVTGDGWIRPVRPIRTGIS